MNNLNYYTITAIIAATISFSCRTLKDRNIEHFGLNSIELEIENKNREKIETSGAPANLKYKSWTYQVKIGKNEKYHKNIIKKDTLIESFEDSKLKNQSVLHLNSYFADKSAIRPLIGQYIVNSFNILTPELEPVSLYLNQKYLGLYYLQEPISPSLFTFRNSKVTHLFQASFNFGTLELQNLNSMKDSFTLHKSPNYYNDLEDVIKKINQLSNNFSKLELENIININSYIDFLVLNTLMNNPNGLRNHYIIYKLENEHSFRFVPHYFEEIFNAPNEKTILLSDIFHVHKILQNKEIKTQFLTKLKTALESIIPLEHLIHQINTFKEQIKAAYLADSNMFNSELEFDMIQNDLNKQIVQWYDFLKKQIEEELQS